MIEFSSCNGSTDKESTLNELEERKNLLTDAEKVQNDFSTERKYLYASATILP